MQSNKCGKFIELAKAAGIEPKVIYDLGSYDGAQAVELSEAFPKAEVFALEADPGNLLLVHERTRQHVNIEAVGVALATWSGLTKFARAIGPNLECGSRLVPNGLYPDAMPYEMITVPCITSADLGGHTGAPDLVWMDLQGCEWDFFACLPMVYRPRLVWMEVALKQYYHGQPLGCDLHGPIERLGYRKIHVEPTSAWFEDWCYQFV